MIFITLIHHVGSETTPTEFLFIYETKMAALDCTMLLSLVKEEWGVGGEMRTLGERWREGTRTFSGPGWGVNVMVCVHVCDK